MNNLSLIVAFSENNAIGKDNKLLWYISEDLKRFKRLTTNKTIVMGRKTFESLPNGALPNRKNIILSKQKISYPNCEVYNNIDDILNLKDEIFIIGGAEIYKQFLPYCDNLYITKVHKTYDGDTFFPQIDYTKYNKIFESCFNGEYSFIDYQLKY